MYFTLEQIKSHNPCKSGWNNLISKLLEKYKIEENIPKDIDYSFLLDIPYTGEAYVMWLLEKEGFDISDIKNLQPLPKDITDDSWKAMRTQQRELLKTIIGYTND